MSQYQIMRWREIPSMVIAREGETTIKVMLAARFQEVRSMPMHTPLDGIVIHGLMQVIDPIFLQRVSLVN